MNGDVPPERASEPGLELRLDGDAVLRLGAVDAQPDDAPLGVAPEVLAEVEGDQVASAERGHQQQVQGDAFAVQLRRLDGPPGPQHALRLLAERPWEGQ